MINHIPFSLLIRKYVLQVTIAVLKFVAELVSNKYHRLKFDISSPNGILLFREVSKLLVAYGSRNVTLSSEKDVYRTKYKGIWISLAIFTKGMDCLQNDHIPVPCHY